MSRVRVAGFGVSVDGFAAGAGQSLESPLGRRGPELFQWFFPTRSFRAMQGAAGGESGPDDDFARRAMEGFGAFILGRNEFRFGGRLVGTCYYQNAEYMCVGPENIPLRELRAQKYFPQQADA